MEALTDWTADELARDVRARMQHLAGDKDLSEAAVAAEIRREVRRQNYLRILLGSGGVAQLIDTCVNLQASCDLLEELLEERNKYVRDLCAVVKIVETVTTDLDVDHIAGIVSPRL